MTCMCFGMGMTFSLRALTLVDHWSRKKQMTLWMSTSPEFMILFGQESLGGLSRPLDNSLLVVLRGFGEREREREF